MKKIFFITTFIFVFVFILLPSFSFAQDMMGNTVASSDGHTAREEAEGKTVWEKLQAKELACDDLSDDNFGALGEYFMGQMTGNSHEAMNNMMIQMMGEQGEEQMHIVWGKRSSGCNTSVSFPTQGTGFMPMMQMLASYGIKGSRSGMMGGGGNSGWIFMVFWWVLIIAGIVVLIKWLTNQSRNTRDHENSPLEILKERYAKGEIDKKEFEDKKKDLT